MREDVLLALEVLVTSSRHMLEIEFHDGLMARCAVLDSRVIVGIGRMRERVVLIRRDALVLQVRPRGDGTFFTFQPVMD